jgi:hypothetical protein
MCKRSGLDRADIEDFTIGMCLDFIDEYVESQNPNKESKAKKASQKDFDSF